MYQPIIKKSYLTEIKLTLTPAVGTRIFFVDVPELSQREHEVYVTGIECFNATYLTQTPNGNTTVSTVAGLVLTVAEASTENVFQYPCTDLQPGLNGGFIRVFNKKKINLSKCYVTILDATSLSVNQAVLFNFLYE